MTQAAQKPPRAVELILKHFEKLEDPRVERTKKHPLENLLVMALCGSICGADGWEDLALFAQARAEWFGGFLDLSNGVPSADTFRRVFSALEPRCFEACFRRWVAALCQGLAGQVVAMDGKAVRGALRQVQGALKPLHLLHAWAAEQQLLLAQLPVEGAPGEVRALPELIQALNLAGAVVTVDANGCTEAVARACHEAKADYVLALKGNRGPQRDYVRSLFAPLLRQRRRALRELLAPADSCALSREKQHGRHERRWAWAFEPQSWPFCWPGLRSAVLLRRERSGGGARRKVEWHLYVSSLPADAERLAEVIRTHWSVENGLHWVLDVGFGEDRRRIRDAAGAENFALISRIALTLLKGETSAKAGIALKRKKAGWDSAYLLRVLSRETTQL
jgi:predicted transposase YbfD/YdcC